MKKKVFPILLIIICTFLSTIAQISYKQAFQNEKLLIFLLYIVFGLFLYGCGSIILTLALKNSDLSLLYPVISTGFIWVAIFGIFLFDELISLLNWFGIFLIVFGVIFLGLGGGK